MPHEIQWSEMIVPNGGIDETVSEQNLKDHRWAAANNVEALHDGVRLRPGSIRASTTAVGQTLPEFFEDGAATEDIGLTYSVRWFTNAAEIDVFRVSFRLKKAGTPTGTLSFAIYTNSGGFPGTPLAGADFTDWSTITIQSLTLAYDWYDFLLPAGVTLAAGTVYYLVIRCSNNPNSVFFEAGDDADGGAFQSAALVSFAAYGNDHNYRVYDGQGYAITAIADYRLSDASTSRHLIVAGGKLFKNVAGTVTQITSTEYAAGATPFSTSANVLQSWAVGQDRWFVTDGTDEPKKFYVLSSTEYFENEGIAPPTATPTAAVGGAGDPLTDGAWEFDYLYWNNDLGIASELRFLELPPAGMKVTTTSDEVNITGLPSAVVRTGDRATHKRIYAKSPGSTIFRLIKTISLAATSATILGADEDAIGAQNDPVGSHVIAPNHTIKVVGENQQFISGIAATPYRVYGSNIIGVTPYYESFPVNRFRDFGRGDGDYVTALFFMPPRTLVVGCRNSIWAVDARRFLTSDRFLISKEVGIAGHRAGCVSGNRLYFWSDAERNKGPYVWQGQDEPQLLMGIDDTFKALTLTRLKYTSCEQYSPGDNRFQWISLATSGGGSQHDIVLVYDYVLGAWMYWTRPALRFVNVLGSVEGSTGSRIYMGGYDGFEYQHDSGTTDAGAVYSASVKLKRFDAGSPQTTKRLRWCEYVAEAQSDGSMLLTVERDVGVRGRITVPLPQQGPLGSGGVFELGTSELGGGSVLGGGEDLQQRVSVRGRCKRWQPTISAETDFFLKGIAFGVQPAARSK